MLRKKEAAKDVTLRRSNTHEFRLSRPMGNTAMGSSISWRPPFLSFVERKYGRADAQLAGLTRQPRLLRAKSDHAFAPVPKPEAFAKTAQIILVLFAATAPVHATTNAFENRMVGLSNAVVRPPSIPTLFDKPSCFQKTQVAADFRLGNVQGVGKFSDGQAVRCHQQATNHAEAQALAEDGEKGLGGLGSNRHVSTYMHTCMCRVKPCGARP